MDITFKCPNCDQELEVDESASGSSLECPSCNTTITVPADAARAAAGETAQAETGEKPPAPPQKAEKHFSVPVHEGGHSAELLIKKTARPLEIAAQDTDKTVRIKTFKRTDCVEVGKDKFDEQVSAFLARVGQPNIISINPISYSYVELGSHSILNDYGVTIVFRG